MTSAKNSDLQDSIRLAVEAAEAANDSAEDLSRIRQQAETATARLDRFAGTMRPLMLGILGGTALSLVLGGLVYFRTVAELRSTTATQIEALKVFTESVQTLNGNVDAVSKLTERLTALEDTQSKGFAALQTSLDKQVTELRSDITGFATKAGNLQSQIARTITEAVDADGKKTRDSFVGGMSDMELTLSKLIANAWESKGASATHARKTSAPSPSKTTRPSTRRSGPARSSAASATAPSVFSYP